MIHRLRAVIAHESRSILRDPFPYLVLLGMPLVALPFAIPVYKTLLQTEGFPSASGAEHAVPAVALLFVFFLVGNIGFSFFYEHTNNTWTRLLHTHATLAEIVVGKAAPYVVLVMVQQALVLVLGEVLFDLRLGDLVATLLLVPFALAVCLTTLGAVVAAVGRSMQQVSAIQTIGTMVLVGIGGVFTPMDSLPDWAGWIAPLTPTYWVMQAYHDALLSHAPASRVVPECLVLLGMATVYGAAAVILFRRSSFNLSK
jgi:ABC-2 type transport system permease protein